MNNDTFSLLNTVFLYEKLTDEENRRLEEMESFNYMEENYIFEEEQYNGDY